MSNPISEHCAAQAFATVVANEHLHKMEEDVYAQIAGNHHDPLTRNELYKLYPKHPNPEGTIGRLISDLIKYGYVQVVGERTCRVSGNPCGVHQITEKADGKFKVKTPTNKEKRSAGAYIDSLLAKEPNAPEIAKLVTEWLKNVGL